MEIGQFMATPLGRGTRVAAGTALIGAGFIVGGRGGVALGVAGLVPLYAGVANVCLIAAIIDAPFRGSEAHES